MSKIIHNGQKEFPKLYYMWYNMRARCKYKCTDSWERYGGRGIKVCKKWNNSFVKFRDWALLNGYKDGLIIDRINNNKGYKPSNIRFVNAVESSYNREIRSDNITGVSGIRFRKNNNPKSRYTAIIYHNKKEINLGSFETLLDAVNRRNNYILFHNLPQKIQ